MERQRKHTLCLLAFLVLLPVLTVEVRAGRLDEKKVAGWVNKKGFAWRKHDTDHFRIYVEAGQYADTEIERLKARVEAIRDKTLKFIGGKDEKASFVFLVDSRKRMRELTGDEVNGLSIADKRAVFMVLNSEMRGIPNHEFFHLYAYRFWKRPKETFVSEGMAVYSDDKWHSQELHPLVSFLKAKGKLIPIRQLVENFRKQNDLISYPQAGSFMKFLSEKYGKDKVTAVWKSGEKVFAKAYGKNVDELEKEWLAFIAGYDASGIKYQGW